MEKNNSPDDNGSSLLLSTSLTHCQTRGWSLHDSITSCNANNPNSTRTHVTAEKTGAPKEPKALATKLKL